jgi:tetratricopeptide (TPR) repeat protein
MYEEPLKVKRISIIAAISISALLLLNPRVFAETKKTSNSDIIVGAKAGYSLFEGYYRSRFMGSYYVGASVMYGNPAMVKFLMGEFEITFARYPLKESRSSYLQSISANIGPVLYYPVARYFQVYAGASAVGSYLLLHTNRTDMNEKSFKPGLLAKAGFFFPIQEGFRIRLGAEYTLQYLSSRPLHGLNIIGGLCYNFNPDERSGEVGSISDPAFRIEWYMSLADTAVRKGDIEDAKDNYNKILVLDRTHREARAQLDGIKKAEADNARALKLIGEKRYYDALPFLDDAGKYLASAREEQNRIRKQLTGEIPALEKKGIDLYEKGDYRGCITIMNRLLLIDPKNKVGMIYLPRAVKRQEALERLR